MRISSFSTELGQLLFGRDPVIAIVIMLPHIHVCRRGKKMFPNVLRLSKGPHPTVYVWKVSLL